MKAEKNFYKIIFYAVKNYWHGICNKPDKIKIGRELSKISLEITKGTQNVQINRNHPGKSGNI